MRLSNPAISPWARGRDALCNLAGPARPTFTQTPDLHEPFFRLRHPVATYWFRPDSYLTLEYERTKKSMNGYVRGRRAVTSVPSLA